MKLTVLGCWSPFPSPGGACSGYLVENLDAAVLLDCGHGVVGKLLSKIAINFLNAVVISHFHPDHCADLFALRHAVRSCFRNGTLKGKIPLYVPSQPLEDLHYFKRCEDAFSFHYLEEVLPEGVRIGDLRLNFMPVRHKVPTYATAVDDGHKRMVYSGDTMFFEEFTSFLHKADLFLSEASVRGKDKEYAQEAGHLTPAQAAELAVKGEVGQLLLTHFWPKYRLRDLHEEAEIAYGKAVELVSENMEYTV